MSSFIHPALCGVGRYILEARKRALAKKKKLRTLGRRARSQGSDDEEEEVDGKLRCHASMLPAPLTA
jgi:hypothetical protein